MERSGGRPLVVIVWLSLDLGRHIPWQQLSHPVDRMLTDALQHMAQVRLGVESMPTCPRMKSVEVLIYRFNNRFQLQ